MKNNGRTNNSTIHNSNNLLYMVGFRSSKHNKVEVGEKMNWYEKRAKELGYKGCRNCIHQIDVLRACKWLEQGGDGQLHLICPRWEKKIETISNKNT